MAFIPDTFSAHLFRMADELGHDWRNRETYDADDGSVVDW
jgi:hypothetical protein